MEVTKNISEATAKKIFGNTENAENFLLKLQKIKQFDLSTRKIKSGKNKGKETLVSKKEVWSKIIEHWDYEASKKIIRELFRKTEKYKSGKKSYQLMNCLFEEWRRLKLGNIKWSFSQGAFDSFVQSVNAQKKSRTEKDKRVKIEAVKYRRIKEINTVRNDFFETLIFEKKENVLPTLTHRRSTDYFINGISFDQKVSKSPTDEFINDFGENWQNFAIENPKKVAEYLYKHQDVGRFGTDNRLLVVYLDKKVEIERIEEIIQETNFEKPLTITFAHKTNPDVIHQVNCFVILLYN